MNRPFDLQGKLYAMRVILERARRAATELNTQARKYKIPITINEAQAEVR